MSLFVSAAVRRRLAAAAAEQPAGKLDVPSFLEARRLAEALELEQAGASSLNAVSLLEEALRQLLDEHRRRFGGDLEKRLARRLRRALGRFAYRRLLTSFARDFGLRAPSPPARRAAGKTSSSETREEDGAEVAELLRELVVFACLRSNPATGPVVNRLAEGRFVELPELERAAAEITSLLAAEPGLYESENNLLATLEAPTLAAPDSPVEQLRWLRERRRPALGELDDAIGAGLDLAAEETAPRFPPGPGPVEAPSWAGAGAERRYSDDRGWMRELVLVAKNCLVWLEQLSREHGRELAGLGDIPDEALAQLAERGFNGLWLIGLWERSPASRRIKRLCGNPEAEASAYSVRGYRIARRLGGDEGLEKLRQRAERHGIRLAADMVPNHTALDSDWVVEHPERFIGQADCPFPAYTFEGPDLSPDPRVTLQLEDHYFDRTDAAVVFRRHELASGETRFLYHGNDGTSMPWNDTAQLDYLQPATREAVIEQIVAVAERFPVIRFDAAMTLTRHHFQRLWYPRPGEAGAIPSRAEHALASEEFDRRMPAEFWREVVDRLAAEAPDTLLLAEAFWLMEGYFVRTLGMHRVYNSAFMHMLRDGDNAGLRKLIAEALAFDPAVLERFVNFLSNPDEATAAEQFGRGARDRGACVLLATLPGLPMFAHGQVEGFAERYGMEYGRSYHAEVPDPELTAWHRERIAPLLARRELFAGAERFQLLDFAGEGGGVDPAVLAYVNGTAGERRLVVFNHRDAAVRGRLGDAVPRAEFGAAQFGAAGAAGETPLVASATLVEALALDPTRARHVLEDALGGEPLAADYRELAETGLELELGPFECRVLAPRPAVAAADGAGQLTAE